MRPKRGLDWSFAYFKGSSFDVGRYNFFMTVCLNLRSHLSIMDFVSASGKFFFAVARLSDCHRISLVATTLVYFNLRDRKFHIP